MSLTPADRFESDLWRRLRTTSLASAEQTKLGVDILKLLDRYFGEKPGVRLHEGRQTHYFADDKFELSRCGRVERIRLSPDRITSDPASATCHHCRNYGLRDTLSAAEEPAESTCIPDLSGLDRTESFVHTGG